MIDVIVLTISFFIILYLYLRLFSKYNKLKSRKQSLSTKYGQITEQFLPFMKDYPYNEKNFRFLGNPIDGIQFNDDKLVFLEFKSNKSQLSRKQKKIKDLVNKGKVEFRELRLE